MSPPSLFERQAGEAVFALGGFEEPHGDIVQAFHVFLRQGLVRGALVQESVLDRKSVV